MKQQTNVIKQQKSENKYVGLVGVFKNSTNDKVVLAYGNDIAGTVAAVKRLIDARNTIFVRDVNQTATLIDDYDTTGISVMDVMINTENRNYYKTNTQNFRRIVERILNDNQFEFDIKTVKSFNDNTTLRVKHVNADYSSNYEDAVVVNNVPVILAGGLFSDLFRFEKNDDKSLAHKLSVEDARDVWEIEITGGPGQDSATSPNYNFTNMTEYYWPALIAGVENYSRQNAMQYIGFSNGCRAALSSLDRYDASGKTNAGYIFDQNDGQYKAASMSANVIRDFIGVGCPGAFNGSSPVGSLLNIAGNKAVAQLERDSITHLSLNDAYTALCRYYLGDCSVIQMAYDGVDAISLGLFKSYVDFATQTSDPQPGGNVSITYLTLIYGTKFDPFSSPNDGVVTEQDHLEMFNMISATDKKRCPSALAHDTMPDHDSVKNIVKKRLSGQSPPFYWGCKSS